MNVKICTYSHDILFLDTKVDLFEELLIFLFLRSITLSFSECSINVSTWPSSNKIEKKRYRHISYYHVNVSDRLKYFYTIVIVDCV